MKYFPLGRMKHDGKLFVSADLGFHTKIAAKAWGYKFEKMHTDTVYVSYIEAESYDDAMLTIVGQ